MEQIRFLRRKLPCSLLEYARVNRLFRGMTATLLQAAFDHNGYIARGFGTLLACRFVIDAYDDELLHNMVRCHLGRPMCHHERPAGAVWSDSGDIDLWFPSRVDLDGFLSDERRRTFVEGTDGCSSRATNTGNSIDHVAASDARVQVILPYLLPIEPQLAGFDIYNGMVAVTADEVIFPDQWEWLERGRLLHVTTWDASWTARRCMKWLNSKGYSGVTPATADGMVDDAVRALDWYSENKGIDTVGMQAVAEKDWMIRVITQRSQGMQHELKKMMRVMSPERLLMLSAYFHPPSGAYDFARAELIKRMRDAMK